MNILYPEEMKFDIVIEVFIFISLSGGSVSKSIDLIQQNKVSVFNDTLYPLGITMKSLILSIYNICHH